jgi:hypothetical protein
MLDLCYHYSVASSDLLLPSLPLLLIGEGKVKGGEPI